MGAPVPDSIGALDRALAAGEVTAADALATALGRIDRHRHLGAWLAVDAAGAERAAAASDRRRQEGRRRSPLDGVPVAIKDALHQAGQRTTCASRMLEHFVSPFSATVVTRLEAAGAVIVGKLNMDEFAMGSSSEHSAFGPVLNPFDPKRVAGGSSGGSAAAVATGDVWASLGSDTGGSIRQPAAFCGIVGLKPTYGRVSRHGLVAYASSLDQVGPMARSVEDCALVLEAIAGHDPKDATSLPDAPLSWREGMARPLAGRRLGVPRQARSEGLDPAVQAGLEAAVQALGAAGAELVEIDLPTLAQAIATYYVIAPAEACSNLARYDGVRYGPRGLPRQGLEGMVSEARGAGFGPEVQRRLVLGTYVTGAERWQRYFGRAQAGRRAVVDDFARAFTAVEALVLPTSPDVAFPLGACGRDPVRLYLADLFTVGANLAGLPAISVPAGRSPDGLPVGVQLIGPALAEAGLINLAWQLERALPRAAGVPG